MSQNLAPAAAVTATPTTDITATALSNAASTAVVELANIPNRGDARKAKAKARKHIVPAQPQGDIAPAQERADIITAGAAVEGAAQLGDGLTAAAVIQAIDHAAANDLNINNPNDMTPAERSMLLSGSKLIAMGVGLGSSKNEHAYGPMVRTVLIKMVAAIINKRTPAITDLTFENLEQVLLMDKFQDIANGTLDMHLLSQTVGDAKRVDAGGTPVSEFTLAARKKNADLARKWITSGMHSTYLEALRIIKQPGRVTLGDTTMPLDRALALAMGRNITANECYRAEKAAMNARAAESAAKQMAVNTPTTTVATTPAATPAAEPVATPAAEAVAV